MSESDYVMGGLGIPFRTTNCCDTVRLTSDVVGPPTRTFPSVSTSFVGTS